jgi:ribosomal protein S12 methylthiotransferase accessory factor
MHRLMTDISNASLDERGLAGNGRGLLGSFLSEELNGHRKSYTEGTHRSRSPEETLNRVQRYFPIFGITRVANITGLDTIGIPVVIVVRPNSKSLSVSQGKGASLVAAKVSGIMESIEGYHAETLDIETRFLSHDELRIHHRTVDLQMLPVNRERPLPPDLKIPWVRGRDVMSGVDIWIPYEMVHLDYTDAVVFNSGYFLSDSNGLASGNCLIEAVNHGLCEVIERDGLTLWSLKDKRERDLCSLDLSSVDDPGCAALIQKFKDQNIDVAVWDITSDIAVPAYCCKILQSGQGAGIRPAMGAGCHPCKAIALSRALTEAAQSRLTFISGSRDDQLRDLYKHQLDGSELALWRSEIDAVEGKMNYADREEYKGTYLEDDLEWILAQLRKAKIGNAVYIDLTKPEFSIPVVKVVIPGLECHTMAERRIPGRRAQAVIAQRDAGVTYA